MCFTVQLSRSFVVVAFCNSFYRISCVFMFVKTFFYILENFYLHFLFLLASLSEAHLEYHVIWQMSTLFLTNFVESVTTEPKAK